MKLDALGKVASLFGSHLFLAITFALAWLVPGAPFAANRADSALIMLLEGVALVAASDSFLRGPIDAIPRAILHKMQSNPSPEMVARLGVCRTCLHAQPAVPQREGRDVRCQRALGDPSFAEFPATPLTACRG